MVIAGWIRSRLSLLADERARIRSPSQQQHSSSCSRSACWYSTTKQLAFAISPGDRREVIPCEVELLLLNAPRGPGDTVMSHEYDDPPVTNEAIESAVTLTVELRSRRQS